MFYTLGSWNRILHLGSQACGIPKSWVPEWRAQEKERKKVRKRTLARARQVTEREGVRGEGTPGIHAPGLRGPFRLSSPIPFGGPGTLERALRSGAAVYGRHYLDRPRVGLNDLFVCTFYFIGRRLLRDT